MNATKGYYSLIQYCPDRSRMEAVNVGLVLFAPELNFLRARVSKNNNRVRKFFGAYSFNNEWLQQAKDSIVQRLHLEKEYIQDREGFEKFIRARANELILSDVIPLRIHHPDEQLDQLFDELVTYEKAHMGRRTIIQEIDSGFRSHRFENRIQFNKRIEIPVVERGIDIPYMFVNGCPNLVKTQEFHGSNINRAMELSVEGEILQKKANYKFIVIPKITQEVNDINNLRYALTSIFELNNIKNIWPENYDQFLDEVDRVASPINEK